MNDPPPRKVSQTDRRCPPLPWLVAVLFGLASVPAVAQALESSQILLPAQSNPQLKDTAASASQNITGSSELGPGGDHKGDLLEIPNRQDVRERNRERRERSDDGDFRRDRIPYLGITVRETVIRTLGPLGDVFRNADVPGLEIEVADANSPAADAGLRGVRTGTKDLSTAGLVRRPSQIVDQIMATADVYDTGGDLITAIDGRRVTNRRDFAREVAKLRLKPGDAVDLTIIRRVRSWRCVTMNVAMRLGEWSESASIADSP